MSEHTTEQREQPRTRRPLRERMYHSRFLRAALGLGIVAAGTTGCGPAKPAPHKVVPIARCYDKPQPSRARSNATPDKPINIGLSHGSFTGDFTPTQATQDELNGAVVQIVETYGTGKDAKQQGATGFVVNLPGGGEGIVSAGHVAVRNDLSLLVAKDRFGHTTTFKTACYMRENGDKFVPNNTLSATEVDVLVLIPNSKIGRTVLHIATSDAPFGAVGTVQGYGYAKGSSIPSPNDPRRFNVLKGATSKSITGPVVLDGFAPKLPHAGAVESGDSGDPMLYNGVVTDIITANGAYSPDKAASVYDIHFSNALQGQQGFNLQRTTTDTAADINKALASPVLVGQ